MTIYLPCAQTLFRHGTPEPSAAAVEIFYSLATSKSNRDIAHTLAFSVCTVENHAARIYAKIG
jgi:DNA-binding NarL/FixJ family response regulator